MNFFILTSLSTAYKMLAESFLDMQAISKICKRKHWVDSDANAFFVYCILVNLREKVSKPHNRGLPMILNL